MLTEFHHVRQEPAAGRRRWFDGHRMELVVWFDAKDKVSGFQLCYGLADGEGALTWRPGAGFSHSLVDEGDDLMGKKTPVLVAGGPVPWEEIERRFQVESVSLEPVLRELVAARLAARQ